MKPNQNTSPGSAGESKKIHRQTDNSGSSIIGFTLANSKEKWIDKQDILTRMHISDRTLQNWRSKKLIPFSRICGKIFYRESDLQRLLENNLTKLIAFVFSMELPVESIICM